MAELAQLESALIKADAAGDAEGARVLAGEIRLMRSSAPAEGREAPKPTALQKPPREAAQSLFASPPGLDTARNIGMGAIKGASDIGATAMWPLDASGVTGMTNKERRASMRDFFTENADPESLAFKGGELGSQIAGTAGVGGVMAKGAQAVPALSKLATALKTGGFNLGEAATGSKLANALMRTGAGAITGGAAIGMVNPDEAGTGAMIGGAMPGGAKLAGMLGQGAKKVVGSTVSHLLGATTGTGAEAVRGAYRAGKTGASEFVENMRGKVPFDDVVEQAREGIRRMRLERAADYRSGMLDISKDKSVLNFKPVMEAIDNVQSMGAYKGQQINKHAASVVDDLAETVRNWAKLKPNEFHTPEGLDALKQAVGDIRDTTQAGTAARRAADTVYNAVKTQITEQAPVYSKVMKDYSTASKTISEVEKALSLGEKASKDTAIRKLQSLTRNNAQTNYGNRLAMANALREKGGTDLMPAISGQSMSSWTPRGMVGALEKAGLPIAAYFNPAVLATAPITSPRLVGETAYGLGRASGKAGELSAAAKQALIKQLRQETIEQAEAAARVAAPLILTSP